MNESLREERTLTRWSFSIPSLGYEESVTLPHTWNVCDIPAVQLYRGEAVYRTSFTLGDLRGKRVILRIGAAYHTASIELNGQPAGFHTGSGYLPFGTDLTAFAREGENDLQVTVGNAPKEDMLPSMLHFDWADDGGLYRDVRLIILPEGAAYDPGIGYELTELHGGTCGGRILLSRLAPGAAMDYRVTHWRSGGDVLSGRLVSDAAGNASIPFGSLLLWSPASPELYTVTLTDRYGEMSVRTGFRQIAVRGTQVLLNGEPVRLKGCEWMPGSDPSCGMAEPAAVSRRYLQLLTDAGCTFTRFHWQQDSSVYDWCDEHGLMVQEEIPFWGEPKKVPERLTVIAKQHADGMLRYHSRHPSIVCWGVGNELGGELPETIAYVDEMVRYFRQRDPLRLVNYVSNSLGRDANAALDDAALHGDIAMWNEYLGLWQPCDDIGGTILRTARKCAGKPLMITEFGLCEPAFAGGDARRAEILRERVPLYRQLENYAGYVWFCLNDYRTQYGEEGEGRMRRRVHGSADLLGCPKPSYRTLCGMD